MGVNIEIMGSGGGGGPATGDIPPPLVLNEAVSVSITANQNNWNPGGAYPNVHIIRLTTDATRAITGLDSTGVVDGQVIVLQVVGANRVTLNPLNAGSSAANQFILAGASNITLVNDAAVILRYDATVSKWRVDGRNFNVNTSAPLGITVDGTNVAGDAGVPDARNHQHTLDSSTAAFQAAVRKHAAGTTGPVVEPEPEYIEPIVVPGPAGPKGDTGATGSGGAGSFVSDAKWEHI